MRTEQASPSTGRAVIDDTGRRLIIEMPARRDGGTVVFAGVWLLFWVGTSVLPLVGMLGAFGASSGTSSAPEGSALGVLGVLVGVGVWTAVGVFAARPWLRTFLGKETVAVDSMSLVIERSAVGQNTSKAYETPHIRNLRILREPPYWVASRRREWSQNSGPLAFDYGTDTVRFGAGLQEGEEYSILRHLRQKLPSECCAPLGAHVGDSRWS